MDAERWSRIEELYHAARARSPDQRAAYLSEACAGDLGLQRDVESLLHQDVSTSGRLDRPAWEGASELLKPPPASESPPNIIGKRISHYRVLERLGEGGMGVVYKAEDTKLRRTVALKFPPVGKLETEEQRARFVREAQAAAALNHPNICTVYEIDEGDGHTLIAMELVEGESVRERVRARPLPLDEALGVLVQAAQGLQAAHEKGVVHRDIKSANIMAPRKGQVKILDFGLAQMKEGVQLTKSGTALGTPAYMSPEQAQARPVDRRTDIWSLGVVFYEMLTGQLPFKGDLEASVVYSVVNEKHEPPTALRSGLPVALDHIIDKALAKRPEERYQHIVEMLVDVRAVRRSLETGDERALLRVPLRGRRMASRRTVVGGAAAVGVLAAVAALYKLNPNQPIDSLAVLPFVNVSSDPETEYLSDGISESLITNLSRIGRLKVKSRDTSFRYKGQDRAVQEIGREIGVSAILTGRLEQRGESMSVIAELVSASDGTVLWRNQYTSPVADALFIDQEISREITEKLELHLTGEEQRRLRGQSTRDPEAYQLYLRGRHRLEKRGAGIAESKELFQQAVAKDPGYGLAWSGVADAFLMLGAWGIMPPGESFPRARAAARRAIEIEETLAEPHATLGYLKTVYERDWAGAEREFRRSVELNSDYGRAHHWFAFYFQTVGLESEALASIGRAWELDPFSPVINAEVAYFSVFARQYERGVREALKAIEVDPEGPSAYRTLARAYALQGKPGESAAAVEQSLRLSQRAPIPLSEGGASLAVVGRKEEARKLLEELLNRAENEYIFPALPALIYACLDEKDRAFEYYEKAIEERSLVASWLRDPLLDGIRSDPRFRRLLERIGLEP